jgi:hypothetical protein
MMNGQYSRIAGALAGNHGMMGQRPQQDTWQRGMGQGRFPQERGMQRSPLSAMPGQMPGQMPATMPAQAAVSQPAPVAQPALAPAPVVQQPAPGPTQFNPLAMFQQLQQWKGPRTAYNGQGGGIGSQMAGGQGQAPGGNGRAPGGWV